MKISPTRPAAWAAALLLLAALPAQAGDVEIVAELTQTPGNVTVSQDGRVFVSMHQLFQPPMAVAELVDGNLVPFPDAAWSDHSVTSPNKLNAVLGIQATSDGLLWMLDNAVGTGQPPKIVAWDLAAAGIAWNIPLAAPAVAPNSFPNDLAVDLDRNLIYIADTAFGPNPALIVVDIATGAARRVLEAHSSTAMEDIPTAVQGKDLAFLQPDGSSVNPRFGVNSIALDAGNEWLYYGPFSGTSLYRVRTADLADATLSPRDLADRVERYADKPLSDGIAIDNDNNIYISDVSASSIGVIAGADRRYRRLHQDEDLLAWPDSFSFGPDGNVYVTLTQLHRAPFMNGGGEGSLQPPFNIVRLKGLAPGVTGR